MRLRPPRTPLRELTALPNSLAELGDWGREEGKGREGRDGRDGEGRKGKGRSTPPTEQKFWLYDLASSH